MLGVTFHPDAYKELEQARSWYEERAVGLGSRFFAEVERAIDTVRQSPDTWPRYAAGTRRFLVHRFPFAIIYRHDEKVIQVVAVMHLKRKPGYWKQRKF